MYKVKDKKIEKDYYCLMESLKKTNLDWLNIRQSKNYRIGMVINKIFSNLKAGQFINLFQNCRKWKLGLKKEIKYKEKIKIGNYNLKPNYFCEERIAIYTCIFGKYDKILEPYFVPDNCDYYIFTDQEVSKDSVWKKLSTPKEIEEMSNVDKNRYIKMFPHKILSDYKYSIYVDGNVQIITDLTEYINKVNPKIGLGIHNHHLRDCVYDELIAVSIMNKKNKKLAKLYMQKLTQSKMPKHYGLLQCNIIARINDNKICQNIMEDWWKEFKNNIRRDQLSLPYVLFLHKINIEDVATLGNNVYKNPSFRVESHK